MNKYIATLVLTALLSACQSTGKQKAESFDTTFCNVGDWTAVGYKLGSSGKSVRKFNKYKAECDDNVNETVKSTFLAGYMSGLNDFCTFNSGYEIGKVSGANNNVCPKELRNPFDKGYKAGLFALKEEKRRQKNRSDAKESHNDGQYDANHMGSSLK